MNLNTILDSDKNSPPIFSVSDLSLALKKTIEGTFTNIRVRGEISGLKHHTSGHVYYTLKDETSVLDAVSWRGSYSSNPIRLEDGLEIIAYGRLTTYPQRSKYQFIVESYQATGQGALLKVLEERKAALAKEGLFDACQKKPIPKLPQIIGVVTSPTGAVIKDILHRIKDRFPCHIIVWPVLVQGPGAAEQIASAINRFQNLIPKPDLLIVARGGGSLEDLWAFNEEIVVRATAACSIPLISAVGHETDTTLIDYASDLRAPTPTGAAELSVPVLVDLWTYLQDRFRRCTGLAYSFLETQRLHLTVLERSIPSPLRIIEEKQLRLDDWQERLSRALLNTYQQSHDRWKHLSLSLRVPQEVLQALTQQYQMMNKLLNLNFTRYVDDQDKKVTEISRQLDHASFHKVLERGFALVTSESNDPIDSVANFPTAKPAKLIFQDGTISVMKVGTHNTKKTTSTKPEQPKLF